MGEGNEKPGTPGRMQLMLEELAAEVKLPQENELRDRLSTVFITKDAREKFIPLLLRHAGRTLPVTEVPAIIVRAMREHVHADDVENMRYFVAHHVPQIIEAFIPDRTQREKAEEFLAGAING